MVAVTLLVVFSASSAIASSGTLHITSNTTLTEDHYGNVLIEGSNITLDCANRTVAGPGVEGFNGGIEVRFSTGVTVKRCKVTAFGVNGIYAVDTNNSRYENNRIIGNGANGIHLDGGVANVITGNTVRSNGKILNGNGIAITRSTQSLIEQNTVQETHNIGIVVGDASHHNTIASNTSSRNYIGVIVGDSSVDNDFVGNIVSSNTGPGFLFVRNANSNSVWFNVVNGNQFGFQVAETCNQNQFNRNVANGNQFEGFNVFVANSNTLMDNTADENGTFGFLVWGGSSFNVVIRNSAHKNQQADGYDEGTGTGNVWMANRFGTTIGF
jgi:parallel beta-helix repeat protein